MYYIRQISGILAFRTPFTQVYSELFKDIQHYQGIFTHILALLSIFRLLQTYSASFQTLTYSQTGQISSPSIFRTGGIFKNLWNFDQAYSEGSERTVYSGIIQPYSGIFRTLCNAYICRNLTYSESWNIQNASIIESRRIFPTLSYLRK